MLLVALLDVGAGPEIVTWPLLLAGAGLGAMASQLGAVTVSAVPDEQSGEVGGLQNTGTQLGASIGTALAGAVLISALTASFFTGIQNNPRRSRPASSRRRRRSSPAASRSSPTPTSRPRCPRRNVPAATADEIVEHNEQSRIDGLRAAVAHPGAHRARRPAVHPGDPDGATRRAEDVTSGGVEADLR